MTSARGSTNPDRDAQTRRSFADKWRHNPQLAFAHTLEPSSEFQQWILGRNGFGSAEQAAAEIGRYRRILDAGCGNGRVTALLASLAPAAEILGIDLTEVDIARANTRSFRNVSFARADLRESLSHLGLFDLIYCQEVLHHTGDPRRAFRNLSEILAPGGKLAIYVYRRKAPAREFMDDYVRDRLAKLDYEEAMAVCRQIAELGRRLAEVEQEVEVSDIPVLGIQGGRYTPQRLLYNFFLKCYWNQALSAEENAAINYDWYHPQHCSRHTMEEVLGWFAEAPLRVTWQHEDLYGITVHGVR
jgi:SAM-dependent methyltransferase